MRYSWLFFSFKGRINRAGYVVARLALSLAFVGMLVLVVAIADGIGDRMMIFGLVLAVAILLDVVVTWASLALDVKRLHDHDLSAWWLLFGLVPVVGLIVPPIVFYLMRGDGRDNRYGQDPVHPVAPEITPNRRLLKALFEVREPTWM